LILLLLYGDYRCLRDCCFVTFPFVVVCRLLITHAFCAFALVHRFRYSPLLRTFLYRIRLPLRCVVCCGLFYLHRTIITDYAFVDVTLLPHLLVTRWFFVVVLPLFVVVVRVPLYVTLLR